jgi:hypothetical protein
VENGWITSSHCGANNSCVEVKRGAQVQVRDNKDPHSPVLTFSREAWQAFLVMASNN